MKPLLHHQTLYRQMANCAYRKTNLITQLEKFQSWFEDHHFNSFTAGHCLKRAQTVLSGAPITFTLVGGLSKGKSELINALLFDQFGQRAFFTPFKDAISCPAEIEFQSDEPSSIKLLPIETRRASTSLEQFKCIPRHWITHTFDHRDPVQVRTAISRITETKRISRDSARMLGFDCSKLTPDNTNSDEVKVPAWRHALVNLDHPMLRCGLKVIDIPGIDVLNNEPGLSLHTLPLSQAVLFTLSADDGPTEEDLAIWNEHIQPLRNNHGTTVLVLVNKIDISWDQVKTPAESNRRVRALRETIARQLKVPMEHVLGVSAKHAVMAKAAQNQVHLNRSNMPQLEMLLAERLLAHQQNLFENRIIKDVISMMIYSRSALKHRLYVSDRERERLQTQKQPLNAAAAITSILSSVKEAYNQHHRQSLTLRSSQHLLDRQATALMEPVNPKQLNLKFNELKAQLSKDSSALGFMQAVGSLFKSLSENLNQLAQVTQQTNQVLENIYKRFNHSETEQKNDRQYPVHGQFDLIHYQQRLMQLKRQADDFHHTMNIRAVKKEILVTRFIYILIEQIKALYSEVNQDILHWQDESLALLNHCIQYNKQLLEKQMLLLVNLSHEKDINLEKGLHELRSEIVNQEAALFDLDKIFDHLEANEITRLSISDNTITLKTHNQLAI